MKQTHSNESNTQLNPNQKRLGMDYGSMAMDGFFGVSKAAAGIFSGSIFTLFHGLYSLMKAYVMGLNADMITKPDRKKELKSMSRSGWILIAMSVLYIICAILTQGNLNWEKYPEWLAWIILIISTGNLIWNLFKARKYSKTMSIPSKTAAILSLADSCINLVLIQSCISYSYTSHKHLMVDMIFGIVMGLISAGLGIYLIKESHNPKYLESDHSNLLSHAN